MEAAVTTAVRTAAGSTSQPLAVGQIHVEIQQVRHGVRHSVHPVRDVACFLDGVAADGEIHGDDAPKPGVVLDDEDTQSRAIIPRFFEVHGRWSGVRAVAWALGAGTNAGAQR